MRTTNLLIQPVAVIDKYCDLSDGRLAGRTLFALRRFHLGLLSSIKHLPSILIARCFDRKQGGDLSPFGVGRSGTQPYGEGSPRA